MRRPHIAKDHVVIWAISPCSAVAAENEAEVQRIAHNLVRVLLRGFQPTQRRDVGEAAAGDVQWALVGRCAAAERATREPVAHAPAGGRHGLRKGTHTRR